MKTCRILSKSRASIGAAVAVAFFGISFLLPTAAVAEPGVAADGQPAASSSESYEQTLAHTEKRNEQLPEWQALHSKLASPDRIKWLFSGDSITHGSGTSQGLHRFSEYFNAYIHSTEINGVQRTNDLVMNTGVANSTTRYLNETFDESVSDKHADVVFIALGMNDSADSGHKERVELNTYQANLESFIARIRAAGAIPIVQTQNYPTGMWAHADFEKYMQVVRDVAEDQNTILIDVHQFWKNSHDPNNLDGWMQADKVHPTAQGYMEWAKFILQQLDMWNADSELAKTALAIVEPYGQPFIEPSLTVPGDNTVPGVADLPTPNSAIYPYIHNKKGPANTFVFLGSDTLYGGSGDISAKSATEIFDEVIRWECNGRTCDNTLTSLRLEARSRFVVNSSYAGQTTATMLASFDADIAPLGGEVLYIVPDVLKSNGTPYESMTDFTNNMRQLVAKAQDAKMKVILVTPPEADDAAAVYADAMIALAVKESLPVIDAHQYFHKLQEGNAHYEDIIDLNGGLNHKGQLLLGKFLLAQSGVPAPEGKPIAVLNYYDPATASAPTPQFAVTASIDHVSDSSGATLTRTEGEYVVGDRIHLSYTVDRSQLPGTVGIKALSGAGLENFLDKCKWTAWPLSTTATATCSFGYHTITAEDIERGYYEPNTVWIAHNGALNGNNADLGAVIVNGPRVLIGAQETPEDPKDPAEPEQPVDPHDSQDLADPEEVADSESAAPTTSPTVDKQHSTKPRVHSEPAQRVPDTGSSAALLALIAAVILATGVALSRRK